MSNNNDSIFADKGEVLANENPYVDKLDQAINGLKHKKRTGNLLILFIPLIIGILVFSIAFVANSFLYISRPSDQLNISLSSKSNVSETHYADHIDVIIDLKNNSSRNIEFVSFRLILKDAERNILLDTTASVNGLLSQGSSASVTHKISNSDFFLDKIVNSMDFNKFWNTELSDIDVSYEIASVQYDDGKFLTYNQNLYMRNHTTYTNILIATFAIWVGWLIYCFMTRCPKCRRFIAMKPAGKSETGRKAGSIIERRAFTDKYGNKVKDSKGKEIYYEETVYGEDVNYKYYHKCKHCGYVKVTRGVEFQR